jgi:hypothetical protein
VCFRCSSERAKGASCLQGYVCKKKNCFFGLPLGKLRVRSVCKAVCKKTYFSFACGLRGSVEGFRVYGLGILRSSWIPRRALCVFCLQGYVCVRGREGMYVRVR